MGVKKIAEEQKIWDEEEEVARSEEEVKKIVLKCFHKQIHVFGKKASKRMFTRKLQDHAIDTKEEEGVFIIERREERGIQVCI